MSVENPNEPTTEEVAAATAADPPPPAATAPPQPAPWTADLERYITDPAARAEADRYMREVQQPRMTALEDSPAARLYKDITDAKKQDATVASVVASIYGRDYAEKFIAMFGEEGEGLEDGQTIEEGVEEAADPADENDAWVAAKRQEEEQAAANAEYDAFMDRVVGDEGNAEWRTLLNDPTFTLSADDKALLSPFVTSSETMGEAIQKYAAHIKAFAAKHGQTPAEAAETKEPPATLGSPGATAATPPVAPNYTKWEDLGAAVGDYQAEQRAKTGPPATL